MRRKILQKIFFFSRNSGTLFRYGKNAENSRKKFYNFFLALIRKKVAEVISLD